MKPSNSIYYTFHKNGEVRSIVYRPNVMIFSGGEIQIRLDEEDVSKFDTIEITSNIRSSNDIMELMLVTDALKHRYNTYNFRLIMPYIPYARQDRRCVDGESLSIKVFANLINSLEFSEVVVWDSHSDAATALLNNCTEIPQTQMVGYLSQFHWSPNDDFILVSPDGGAIKKAFKSSQLTGIPLIQAEKVRDVFTGEITKTIIHGNEDISGKTAVIIDDICDGGRTFIELAKVLRERGVKRIELYITHGIFSKGLEPILEHIDKIYTTDSFCSITHPKLIII